MKLKCPKRGIEYYDRALSKLGKRQTLLLNVSSFASVEILTIECLKRLYNGTLELHEFKKSVVDMRPGLHRDLCFYALFGEGHKYYNGTISGEAACSPREPRYSHHDKVIRDGMDSGNTLSLVIGQPDGAYYRVHKNSFEMPPDWSREIADRFPTFFQNHEYEEFDLFYDRVGNNFEKQKGDYAGRTKGVIEKDGSGDRTGWIVNLKSRKQAVIRQGAEYDFTQELMGGINKNPPILLVDVLNCKEVISSIEEVKAEIKYRGNSKVVFRVKKLEKLALKKLPMLSINFSDAFKYLSVRPGWVALVRGKRTLQADSLVNQWIENRHKR